MKVKLLVCAFSVSMIRRDGKVMIEEVSEKEFLNLLGNDFVSAVGHEITARILSMRWKKEIPFSRRNVSTQEGEIFVAVPQIRFEEAREFSEKEVLDASFRFFIVKEVK